MNTIDEFICCVRHYGDGRNKMLPNGTQLVQHLPNVAPLAYSHSVFPPLARKSISDINEQLSGFLPEGFVEFLLKANGIILFSSALSLYGLRRQSTVGIEAALQEPYDLASENKSNVTTPVPEGLFVVGGYNWDNSKITMSNQNECINRRDNRTFGVLNTWPNLPDFLASELSRMSDLFDGYGTEIDPATPTNPEFGTNAA